MMKEPLSKADIIRLIETEKQFLKREFGVIAIGLFGSYAKGKQGDDSDIDLLVELKEPRFDWLAGLQVHLEQKFGKKNRAESATEYSHQVLQKVKFFERYRPNASARRGDNNRFNKLHFSFTDL